jgi:Na+/proline symporter
VRYTAWIWLLTAFTGPCVGYGTDQLVVQSLLTSKSYAAAKRAVWLKTIGVLPIMATFYAVGLILFYYYHTVETLPEGISSDQVMGHFIIQHLPSPMPGLIVAALLAALMSTIDATINSLSTVTCMDLLKRIGWLPVDEAKRIRFGKGLTFAWGIAMVLFAASLARVSEGVESTVMELTLMWSSLWGVLLVVMLAGVLTKWATARAATAALLVGMALNLTLPWILYYGTPPEQRISFAWVGLPGMLAAGLIVVVGSVLDPRKPKMLEGLTLRRGRVRT